MKMLSAWRHSGFNVFCGNRISPHDETAMENLARYIIRASFSQEQMQYLDQEGKVVYTSKDGKTTKVFPALEWLAAMCLRIPLIPPPDSGGSRHPVPLQSAMGFRMIPPPLVGA